jgi:hypothetical protein
MIFMQKKGRVFVFQVLGNEHVQEKALLLALHFLVLFRVRCLIYTSEQCIFFHSVAKDTHILQRTKRQPAAYTQ